MAKSRTWQALLTISSGVVVGLVLLGGSVLWAQRQGWFAELGLPQFSLPSPFKSSQKPLDTQSEVLPLVSQSLEERRPTLEHLASQASNGIEKARARYLLAIDLLTELEGGRAIRVLEGLETAYPVLAPAVLLKRSRGYELTNNTEQATATLKTLVEQYPDSVLVGEALVKLGATDPAYWDQAIAEYPYHPAVHEMVRDRLDGQLQQPELLLFLVRYDSGSVETGPFRDYLVENYADQLTPTDWQAIADGYWQAWRYGNAASAYRRAPRTAQNFYRIARGQDIAGQSSEAKISYQNLANTFGDAEETGQGLLHLARLSRAEDAIPHLNQVIRQFPDHAPKALVNKADRLDELRRGNAAGQARQALLDRYPNSDATLRYRWEQAQAKAEAGNYGDAWKWAYPIALNDPKHILAPKAAFWVGKWANQLGRAEDAEDAYRYVLTQHPESYYAWRSASLLGLDVGTFTTVRSLSPTVTLPTVRSLPPAGSGLFQELYQLGQDYDARRVWYAEMGDRTTLHYGDQADLTVNEQFTEGMVKVAMGDYIRGITDIWSLKERDSPEDEAQWQALRNQDYYWQTLFPFPFHELVLSWSQERQLNPLLVIALIRQESRFQTDIRSSAGAIGLMQVMPETGEWIAEQSGIDNYQLIDPDNNIQLGTWFLDYTHGEYDGNSMLAIASYNAGPGNVSQWVQRFGLSDVDQFVEDIPFGETQGYVESVFGNYWNYLRVYSPEVVEQITE